MASVNKFIGIGNLTADPTVRYMPNGEAVANLTIAINETWKDKSGVKQEKAEFVNIVMYRRLAEIAGEYLKKGRPVYIEGRLQTRKWEKDGVTRYSTEIVGDQMQMLGSKNADSDDSGDGIASQESARPDGPQQMQTGQAASFDNFDDDIPW